LISELCRIIKKYNLDPSQIFKNFDKSNDQRLDLHEFIKLCHVIDKKLPLDDVKAIFRMFDVEGNGDITLDEFTTALKNNNLQEEKNSKKKKKPTNPPNNQPNSNNTTAATAANN
jgi:Ca2+-binding EF-hand superfamily protein